MTIDYSAQDKVVRKVVTYLVKQGYNLWLYPEDDYGDPMVENTTKVQDIMDEVHACDFVTLRAYKGHPQDGARGAAEWMIVWNVGEPHPFADWIITELAEEVNRLYLVPAERAYEG